MALGVPIVASDLPAIREVTGEGELALLAPPGDAAALAATLRSLLDDRALAATLGERGRARHLECFTPDHEIDGLLQLYRSVMNERVPSS